ncbi:hypothetical protein C2G38_2044084 [Gigaspora rosea]|uniref:Uncharacterized protein n=1 Tax=Gigaspora rosea TaxID=44941 RepID=A0A397ULS9_9GLOM|nr:hypothetical protein C2G38_2044084 [Gigaspora rosea]
MELLTYIKCHVSTRTSLHIAKQITEKQISLDPEFEIIGAEASGDVDFAFRMSKINSVSEELVCITEAKRFIEDIGIIQNIVQLESAFYSNKKQKNGDIGENFKDYYDYLYGIITTESKIDLLAEENSKLLAEISELRKENAEIKAENTKLKQDKEDIEARFAKPEQSDKEKTDLIAKLECDVSLIKQASVTSQSQTTLTMIITQSL